MSSKQLEVLRVFLIKYPTHLARRPRIKAMTPDAQLDTSFMADDEGMPHAAF
jgi:hypothetical protein